MLIRRTEERLLELFSQGKLFGTVHTCIGQEFVGVAVARALQPQDTIFSNHRGHGHFLAYCGERARAHRRGDGQVGRRVRRTGRIAASPAGRLLLERDPGRHRPGRGRIGLGASAPRHRRHLGRVRRRRNARTGRALRGDEHRQQVEPAGPDRLREQPVRPVDQPDADARRRHLRARRGLRHRDRARQHVGVAEAVRADAGKRRSRSAKPAGRSFHRVDTFRLMAHSQGRRQPPVELRRGARAPRPDPRAPRALRERSALERAWSRRTQHLIDDATPARGCRRSRQARGEPGLGGPPRVLLGGSAVRARARRAVRAPRPAARV